MDAIGGSTAGVLVGKKLGVASLIRGVQEKNPGKLEVAQSLFSRIEEEWQCPFEVFNDGDVTALAGAITMKRTGILGVAMGSSEAVGYINPKGALTGRISELAFAPVDLNPNAPKCEWSGDAGVGAMYFSQQAVDHLARQFGMKFPKAMKLPERLKVVQAAMEKHEEVANLPDDDAQADMYFYAVETLEQFGYHQYEISNFAHDGFICRQQPTTSWHSQPDEACTRSACVREDK